MNEHSHSRILREPEVKARTGLSRVSRWRLVRSGQFPAPIQLGPNTIGWREDDIDAWISNRAAVPWAPKTSDSPSLKGVL